MANSNVAMFIQTIQTWALQLVNATGTTITALATAGAQGSKIEAINVSNTDTITYTFQIYINDGTTNHLIASVTIPASAGNVAATAPLNLLGNPYPGTSQTNMASFPVDGNGNRYIYLKTGYSLRVAVTVAVTAAKAVDVVATGGDF